MARSPAIAFAVRNQPTTSVTVATASGPAISDGIVDGSSVSPWAAARNRPSMAPRSSSDPVNSHEVSPFTSATATTPRTQRSAVATQ